MPGSKVSSSASRPQASGAISDSKMAGKARGSTQYDSPHATVPSSVCTRTSALSSLSRGRPANSGDGLQ